MSIAPKNVDGTLTAPVENQGSPATPSGQRGRVNVGRKGRNAKPGARRREENKATSEVSVGKVKSTAIQVATAIQVDQEPIPGEWWFSFCGWVGPFWVANSSFSETQISRIPPLISLRGGVKEGLKVKRKSLEIPKGTGPTYYYWIRRLAFEHHCRLWIPPPSM